MSSIHTELISGIYSILENGDPRIEDYFLMKSPLQITSIILAYLVFVFKLGPAFMKNRPPMKLDKVIMGYNWLQIILNGTIFAMALPCWPRMSLLCSPLDPTNSLDAIQLMNLQYGYTMLKILDLLDTVFFVLRKKHNQVTFLHVYHHLLMVVFTWVVNKYFIGGQIYFLGMANLLVHAVMYFYYFLTAWNPAYSKNLWWKKYITILQIAQHVFVFTSFMLPFLNPTCTYPKVLLGLYLTQAGLMIYLFVDFYNKTYLKTKKLE